MVHFHFDRLAITIIHMYVCEGAYEVESFQNKSLCVCVCVYLLYAAEAPVSPSPREARVHICMAFTAFPSRENTSC